MPRTPIAARLQEIAGEIETGHTRREAIKRAGVAAGGLALAGATPWTSLAAAAPAPGAAPSVAVVGAGLAGLTASYRLKQAGFASTVYEASDHVGGRCSSL